LGTGIELDGLDRGGAPRGQHATGMAGLPHDGIVEPQILRYRVSRALWSCLETLDGPLDLVKQGQHRTWITRIALRDELGKGKTRRGF
jgi:hypothetical protein